MHVGTVAELWRYPVKSMAGERLGEAELSWHGVEGDRRWAFVRPGLERSSFPWLTIRERPEMAHFTPSLRDPARPEDSPTIVRTPDGEELDVSDAALAARLGDGVRVIKQNRGTWIAPQTGLHAQRVGVLFAFGNRRHRFSLPKPSVDYLPPARRTLRNCDVDSAQWWACALRWPSAAAVPVATPTSG